MPRIRTSSVETTPNTERLGRKLARLQPKVARMDLGRGGGGAETWMQEDAQTLAAAIGAYVHGRPSRRLPGVLMMLRLWPQGVRPDELEGLERITTRILAERMERPVGTMVPRLQGHARGLIASGELARMLLDEYAHPTHCALCRGRKEVLRTRDENGQATAPVIVTCPSCGGQGEAPLGIRARARYAGVPWRAWAMTLQQPYGRTLHGYHYLADAAVSGVLRSLG